MKRLTTCCLLLASSCSLLLGTTYERYHTVPGGMGVIYIYSSEITSLQHVHIDRDPQTDGVTHTVSMVKKGYYPYITPPGLVRVLSGDSCVMIPVQVNSHHWIRVNKDGPRVANVDSATAEKEVGGHREISRREGLTTGTGSHPTEVCPLVGE